VRFGRVRQERLASENGLLRRPARRVTRVWAVSFSRARQTRGVERLHSSWVGSVCERAGLVAEHLLALGSRGMATGRWPER
jgi:hypothetical protein